MKISTRSRYGVRLMLDIATYSNGTPVSLRETAKRQQISEKYLEQLTPVLKGLGLIKAVRGASGGYVLAKKTKDITLKEIVCSLEGSTSIVDCIDTPSACVRSNTCASRDVWSEISKNMFDVLARFSLEKLMKKEEQKQIKEQKNYHA